MRFFQRCSEKTETSKNQMIQNVSKSYLRLWNNASKCIEVELPLSSCKNVRFGLNMIQWSSNLLKVRRALTLDHWLRTKEKKSVQIKEKLINAKEINRKKKIKQKLISFRIQNKAWYALIYFVRSTEKKNGLKNEKKIQHIK